MFYFLAEGVRHAARNFKGLDVFAKTLSTFFVHADRADRREAKKGVHDGLAGVFGSDGLR
jgi:hypothetical protein